MSVLSLSAERRRPVLLSRLSAALARSIRPLEVSSPDSASTSSEQSGSHSSGGQGYSAPDQEKSESQEQPNLTLIQGGQGADVPADAASPDPSAIGDGEQDGELGADPEGALGDPALVGQEAQEAQEEESPRLTGFQEILELLSLRGTVKANAGGPSAYQNSLRKQKKSSRFRKGTLVDRKAE